MVTEGNLAFNSSNLYTLDSKSFQEQKLSSLGRGQEEDLCWGLEKTIFYWQIME